MKCCERISSFFWYWNLVWVSEVGFFFVKLSLITKSFKFFLFILYFRFKPVICQVLHWRHEWEQWSPQVSTRLWHFPTFSFEFHRKSLLRNFFLLLPETSYPRHRKNPGNRLRSLSIFFMSLTTRCCEAKFITSFFLSLITAGH